MFANKIVSADEAVAVIRDGDTVCTSGFVGIGTPDELIRAIERRFLAARQPARPDPGVRRGAGRRQGPRAQPPRPPRPDPAGGRRPLVARAEDRRARPRRRDRGLQPAARRHLPAVPRDRGARPRHPVQGRLAYLRRSAPRRRQAQRRHPRGPRRADRDRWRDLAALQALPDQRRAGARHDRRSGRQRHHGAGGADPRQPRDRDGGPELARAGHRPGRAHRGRRLAQPARGRDPRRAGRLRRGGDAREPPPDLRDPLQPAFSGRQRVPLDRVGPAPLDERKI